MPENPFWVEKEALGGKKGRGFSEKGRDHHHLHVFLKI